MQHDKRLLRIQFYLLMGVMMMLAFISSHAGPTTNAPSVLLGWNQVTDPVVIGYRTYYGIASRQYTNSITVSGITNTTCAVTNLARGVTYFFAVTAFSSTLESDYSQEVTWTTTPLPPRPSNVSINQKDP